MITMRCLSIKIDEMLMKLKNKRWCTMRETDSTTESRHGADGSILSDSDRLRGMYV